MTNVAASAFLLVSSLFANPVLLTRLETSPVDLLFVLDMSHLASRGEIEKAREFTQDLIGNLPPGVNVHAVRFTNASNLVRVDPLQLEDLEDASAEDRPTSGAANLSQVFVQAEEFVCPQPGSAKVVVLLLGSSEVGLPSLPGHCGITLFVVDAYHYGRQSLSDLARQTNGSYEPLTNARGYTFASLIKKKVWRPAVLQMLLDNNRRTLRTEYAAQGQKVVFGILLFAFLYSVAHFYHKQRAKKQNARRQQASFTLKDEPRCQEVSFPLGAFLEVYSERGLGGRFRLSNEEPFVLGGRQHIAVSLAHLTIDDPQIESSQCQIYAQGEEFFITDLGTKQRTLVNGEVVAEPRKLAPGDLLTIGGSVFQFALTSTST